MRHLPLAALLLVATSAYAAAPPAQKCGSAKNETAGKLAACLAKAQKKFVLNGDGATLNEAATKCTTKFSAKWQKLEQAALDAGSNCPSSDDAPAIEAFVEGCHQALADALAGGPLIADPITCDATVTECNSNYSGCQGSLASCEADYSDCSADLGTCNGGNAAAADVLSGKTFSSSAGLAVAGTMVNRGAVTLTPSTSDQAIAAGYHNGSGKCAGDPDLVAANISAGTNLFGVTGTALSGQLLRTGEWIPYGAGSDGDLQKGLSRFVISNNDGTVSDLRTGLMWEKKSDDGSIHDQDNTYTWAAAPNNMTGTITTTFLSTLNAGGGFAGYTDWRIPNINELHSLIYYRLEEPAIDGAFILGCAASCTVSTCSCTASEEYWSSTTFTGTQSMAWVVDFASGITIPVTKNNSRRVRAVRGGF